MSTQPTVSTRDGLPAKILGVDPAQTRAGAAALAVVSGQADVAA